MMDEIHRQIRDFIIKELRPDLEIAQLRDDEPLIDSGIIDSLGMLRTMAFLEESLGLDLGSDEVKKENFETVRSIGNMVMRQQGK